MTDLDPNDWEPGEWRPPPDEPPQYNPIQSGPNWRKRIERITGLDLADGRDRLRLHLGLSLAPLVTEAVMSRW